ncbi:coiled-coil domain-containing protein [Cupriavidus metallidurans]|uniref:DNA-binding protein n=1 Tax=Cupriavidus metallidurans TaxID=119219 RepID=UPI000689DFD7|nr:DNA-binding protein [Cupriavidus metallidurans]
MTRTSDTRSRTREAASKIVASGRPAHAITVDLIYAEIRQGSRTTINDELKLWKDEQAKVDALSAALPPAVANAMLATWAVAVEHGEQAYDARRAEVEGELGLAVSRAEAAEAAHASQQAELAALRAQLEDGRGDALVAREETRGEREAKASALEKLDALALRLAADADEAARRLDGLRDSYEQRLQQQREAHAAAEAAFRDELARATERLEGVQRHVMLQVSQAREAQKRAEDQLAKAVQRGERLGTELEGLRAQTVTQAMQLQRATQDHEAAAMQAKQAQAERDELKVQLANTAGRLEGAQQQVRELVARADASASSPVRTGKARRASGDAAKPPEEQSLL